MMELRDLAEDSIVVDRPAVVEAVTTAPGLHSVTAKHLSLTVSQMHV